MKKQEKEHKDKNIKIVCRNKRARFDYELEDHFEAGMVLTGTEVKSLRHGKASLSDSYAKIEDGEVWLIKANISPYPFAHYDNHEPERKRKLLLKKKEIAKLFSRTQERGQSLIPLAIYFRDGYAKVELALAKGKKIYDKRQDLKRKDADREMARAFRRRSEY
ncbi:MAG: SsrA-binding protein SmpB [Pseudomonadota bacterium]